MENNIYLKLAKARIETQKKVTKKSGYNKYADYDYFTLDDFLTIATTELEKQGLIALFNLKKMYVKELGTVEEVATLTITDGANSIEFTTPSAEAIVKGAVPIQNLGSKHTYLKRYLYMNAMELSETDAVDETIGKEEKQAEAKKVELKKATDAQLVLLKKLYTNEELNAILEKANKDIYSLTMVEASNLIKLRRTNNGINQSN